MAIQDAAGIDIRRLMSIARRNVLLIVLFTLAAGLAAYAYSASKTPMFEASALLLYEPQLDITNPLGQGYSDPSTRALQLQSAVTIVSGPEIAKRVAEQLGDRRNWPPHSVSATIISSDGSASGDSISNGLTIAVSSPDAEWAMRLANAYAQEFVAWRVETERARIASAQEVIAQKLKEFRTPAQKASSDFIILSERLRDLEILSATATGSFAIAVPASVPGAPYSPVPRRSSAMGGVLGLLLGLSVAFLRVKLDTNLHSYREVRDIMGLPVIGRIARIPDEALAKGPLVVVSEANGRAAEAVRVLRSNLEFALLGEDNGVLMIVSAQKGEGKSLVTANLAASLALAGKKVVLVDADLRRPRVHSLFKARNASGLSSVIAGLTKLDDALQTVDLLGRTVVRAGQSADGPRSADDDFGTEARLWLLTAGPIPPNPGEMVASRRFATVIETLAGMPFDYVLIDSPAFLAVGDAAALAGVSDAVILVVNMKMTKRPMLEEARDFLAPLPAAKLGVVTVMDDSGRQERYHYYGEGS